MITNLCCHATSRNTVLGIQRTGPGVTCVDPFQVLRSASGLLGSVCGVFCGVRLCGVRTPQLPRKYPADEPRTGNLLRKNGCLGHAFGQGDFPQKFYVRYGFFVPRSSYIDHKMSGQNPPGRAHDRTLCFCETFVFAELVARARFVCGVFAG